MTNRQAPPLEKDVQTSLMKLLKKALAAEGIGFYITKIMESAPNGTPDILLCVNGRFVGLEVKREKSFAAPLTVLQQQALSRIREAGGMALVVYGHEMIQPTIEAVIQFAKGRTAL